MTVDTERFFKLVDEISNKIRRPVDAYIMQPDIDDTKLSALLFAVRCVLVDVLFTYAANSGIGESEIDRFLNIIKTEVMNHLLRENINQMKEQVFSQFQKMDMTGMPVH